MKANGKTTNFTATEFSTTKKYSLQNTNMTTPTWRCSQTNGQSTKDTSRTTSSTVKAHSTSPTDNTSEELSKTTFPMVKDSLKM